MDNNNNNLCVYDNRELSWLKFNMRVLEEAKNKKVPLLERLTFANIFQTNLDEFFMVRVGSLYDQMLIDKNQRENKTYMTSSEQLDAIFKKVRELEPLKDKIYSSIIKELKKYNINIPAIDDCSDFEKDFFKNYFNHEIKPVLSPLIIDKRHPFPFLQNKETYLCVHLESSNNIKIGILPVSGIGLSQRIIQPDKSVPRFMLAEQLIFHYAQSVFDGYKVIGKTLIRVTRNADINAEEAFDREIDFRDAMEQLVKKRKKLAPVRLQIASKFNQKALDYLISKLEISPQQVFVSRTPFDLSFIFSISSMVDIPELNFPPLSSQRPRSLVPYTPIIPQVRKKDVLLSYPFESITPFIKMLEECVNDESVVSVKITLYRLAKNSRIINALVNLAEAGKEVFVLVELRARFDEENNIGWSKRLQRAGVTVIYGPHNLKVHSKLLLITRKNGADIEYITQIGTGNYNEKTSTLYTDLSLITANYEIGLDAANVFNCLALGTLVTESRHLLVAPLCLQKSVLDMIDDEIKFAKAGLPAYVGAKINSLSDKVIIEKLIEASKAGVKVQLVIRGICCLISGVEGITDNIEIVSIVGRFLEHSRIYIFGTPERHKIYISSADYMTRNTTRRIEVAAPLLDDEIKKYVWNMFCTMLSDNVKGRRQLSDGSYQLCKAGRKAINSQEYFYAQAYKNAPDENLKDKLAESEPDVHDEFFKSYLKQ